MYLVKHDTLRDGVIYAKEIDQLQQILNKYEESFKKLLLEQTSRKSI